MIPVVLLLHCARIIANNMRSSQDYFLFLQASRRCSRTRKWRYSCHGESCHAHLVLSRRSISRYVYGTVRRQGTCLRGKRQ